MTFDLANRPHPAPSAETLAWAAEVRRALLQRSITRALQASSARLTSAAGGSRLASSAHRTGMQSGN